MKICRFNEDRLGVVVGSRVFDVSAALAALPAPTWPGPPGDRLIASLAKVLERIDPDGSGVRSYGVDEVRLQCPVTGAGKLIAAPANYRAHAQQDTLDPGVDHGIHRKSFEGVERPVDKLGLFLKATSALAGPADGIRIGIPDRRCDHEIEIVAVIGRSGANIPRADARTYIAGYTLGLDMTYRGAEDRSFRKSADGFALVGPWIVTADEIPDPDNIEFWLAVNGQERQRSSTAQLTVGISELIEIASRMYTLHPGDMLFTGTPEGVGPVVAGNVITVGASLIGTMQVQVHG